MKIFFVIIAVIVIGISGFNIISRLIDQHDLTAYDKGFMVGNLLLLIISFTCLFALKRKSKH